MGTKRSESANGELGYWGFVEYAMTSPQTTALGIDTEAARLFMTLNRSTKLVFYDLQASVRGTEVSEAGFSLLFVLYQTGEVTMKKLVELSGMSKASVSAIVRTLAADGYVERSRSKTDGRSLAVKVTDAGKQTVERIYPKYNQRERGWADLISEHDRVELLRILNALMDGGREARRRT